MVPRKKEETDHQRNERMLAQWTRRLGQFTIVLAIVAAITAVILYLTDQTSRIANRAYVFISDIRLAPFYDDGKLMWSIIPVWENGGNTTTRETQSYINLAGLTAGELPAYFSRCDFQTDVPNPNIVLGPKQASNLSFMERSPELFSRFQEYSMKKLYIWGYARYQDQFSNDQRITRFCFDVQRVVGSPNDGNSQLKILYALCPVGNCADEQCNAEDRKILPSETATCKLQVIPNQVPESGSTRK